MPIHTGQDKKGHFYQWGSTGKKYYYDPVSRQSATTAYNKAKRQEIAIYSSGWKGDGEKMKIVRVKRTDVENGEILDRLDDLSRIFKITAIRIDKDLNVNYSGRTVASIEKEINRLRAMASRLMNEANEAAEYVKKTKAVAEQFQKQIQNQKVLVR